MTRQRLLAGALMRLLASTMVMMCKFHLARWRLIDQQDTEFWKSLQLQQSILDRHGDTLAALLKRDDRHVVDKLWEVKTLSSLRYDLPGSAQDVAHSLAEDHDQLIGDIRFVFVLSEELNDQDTSDSLVEMLKRHENSAKTLRAFIR